MAQKNMYKATINFDGGTDILDVDMLNLPYDMFGPKFPLEIQGDVDMGKGKGRDLPDMANVIIRGAFDCSTCTITSETILPGGITELVCKHSIGGLDVLVGKLPDSVQKVVVRSAVFSAIKECFKKSAQDDTDYKNATKFIEVYPNIVVTDGKKTLIDVIKEHTEKVEPVKATPVSTAPVAPRLELQTDQWLSVNDLVPICEEKLGPDLLARLDKELKRYIRQVLNVKSAVKIESREMQRSDGTCIKCIRKEDASLVVEQIIESILAQDKSEQKETKAKKASAKTSVAPKVSTESRKYYIDNREIERVKIKK